MSLPMNPQDVNIPPTTMETGSNPVDSLLELFADALFCTPKNKGLLSAF